MKKILFSLMIVALFATTAYAASDFHDFKTGKHHNAINIYMPETDEINVANVYDALVWLKNNTLNADTLSNYVLNTTLTSTLADYALLTEVVTADTLSNYVLNTALSNTLLSYATNATLSNYVLNTALTNTLLSYALKTDVSAEVNLHKAELTPHGLPDKTAVGNQNKYLRIVSNQIVAEDLTIVLDHRDLTNIGTLTHDSLEASLDSATQEIAALDLRLDSVELVFQGGVNGQVLTRTATGFIWATPSEGVTDHTLLSNIGTTTHANIDLHITTTEALLSQLNPAVAIGNSKYWGTDGSGTKGYYSLPTVITDHAALSNIGTNTHAQLDTFKTTAETQIGYINPSASIGNSKYFGTNASGTKGYHDLPASSTGITQYPYSAWTSLDYVAYRTDDDTFTIIDNATTAVYIKKGLPVKFYQGATAYYAIMNNVTDGGTTLSVDICGAPFTADVSSGLLFTGGVVQIRQINFAINGYFADAAETTLLANDMFTYYKWDLPKAYLCKTSLRVKTIDSGASNSRVNITLGTADVLTTNSNAGLTVASAWANNTTDISTTNYDVDFGDTVEIKVDDYSTNKDARDLSVQLNFVIE